MGGKQLALQGPVANRLRLYQSGIKMDPLSSLASIAGILSVASRTSTSLHDLYDGLKNGPELILALSNEIADLSITLDRVLGARDMIQQLDSVADQSFATQLEAQVEKARYVVTELDTLCQTLSEKKRSSQRVAWLLHQGKAAVMKEQVREVRLRINDMLVAHNMLVS